MEKLNEVLQSYMPKGPGEKTTKDQLLGAAFVVVNKDGTLPLNFSDSISKEGDHSGFTN